MARFPLIGLPRAKRLFLIASCAAVSLLLTSILMALTLGTIGLMDRSELLPPQGLLQAGFVGTWAVGVLPMIAGALLYALLDAGHGVNTYKAVLIGLTCALPTGGVDPAFLMFALPAGVACAWLTHALLMRKPHAIQK